METLPVNLLAGRLPENSSEVVIPAHLAANGGVKFSIGETITLAVGNRKQGSTVLTQHDPYQDGAEVLDAVMQKKLYSGWHLSATDGGRIQRAGLHARLQPPTAPTQIAWRCLLR